MTFLLDRKQQHRFNVVCPPDSVSVSGPDFKVWELVQSLKQSVTVCNCVCLQTFYHGEPVKVNVEITNSSSKNIKDISVSGNVIRVVINTHHMTHQLSVRVLPTFTSNCLYKQWVTETKWKQFIKSFCWFVSVVEQVTNVVLYSNDKYVKSVAKEETKWVSLFLLHLSTVMFKSQCYSVSYTVMYHNFTWHVLVNIWWSVY